MRRATLTACLLVVLGALWALTPAAQAAPEQTVVSITFDDGFASQMRAVPLLERHGFRGTFYINSELLNGADRLTFAQVRGLSKRGHEIGGHTSDHTDLVTVDAEERARQICNDRVALAGITGRAPRSFAYPYGASDKATERIVARCGYTSARIVGGLTCAVCAQAESFPPADRYAARTSYSFVADTRVADAERAIARVAQNGGGWVPLVFHEVCDGCSEMGVRPRDLDALLTWIAARRSQGIVVRTVGAVVAGRAHALVRAPRHSGPYAQVANANLSSAGEAVSSRPGANGDGIDMEEVTRCWRRAGFGVSKATWTRGPVGIGRSMAETVTVSGYESGDRKLIVRPDGGSCSVRVMQGSRYRISVWYRSTAPISLTAYVRDSAGRWRFWMKSPPARPSQGWSRLWLDLPPVAGGVANVSFGASIAANGRMTVDNFGIAAAPRPAESPTALGLDLGSRSLVASALLALVGVPVMGAVVYDRIRRRRPL